LVDHARNVYQYQIKDTDELRERSLAVRDELEQRIIHTAVEKWCTD